MSKNTEKNNSCPFSDRLGKVGGQAVLEGVMMKAGNRMVTTCRKPDGSLVVNDDSFVSAKDKNKLYGLPLVRGVVSFVESMLQGYKALSLSAEKSGFADEETDAPKTEEQKKKDSKFFYTIHLLKKKIVLKKTKEVFFTIII